MQYDVFISSKSEDNYLAEEIYYFLKEKGLSVFIASKELDKIGEAQYADAIDAALDATQHMIVVASSVDNINSKWVHYEWSTFSNDLRSGFRKGNLITVLKSVPIRILPPALRHQQSFLYESIKEGRILNYLKPLTASSQEMTIDPQETVISQNSSNLSKEMVGSFVCSSAIMRCSMGTSIAKLTILPTREIQHCGKFVANISDHNSLINLAPFGLCRSIANPATASATAANNGKLTPMPCIHNTPVPWTNGDYGHLVKGLPALQMTSKCHCMWGGTISLITDGIGNTNLEQLYEEEFIVKLTIDGTEFEEVEVEVIDPNKTIREQVRSIVQVFGLPEMNKDGHPVQYVFCQILDEGKEPIILEFKDEDGHEQCLLDYYVQPGDHLHLVSIPVAGGSEMNRNGNDNTFYSPKKQSFIQKWLGRKK